MQQLNCMLHGAWVIEENDDGIRFVTIRGHGHHIVAGNRDNPTYQLDPNHPPEEEHDMDPQHDPNAKHDMDPQHDQMEEYTLRGVMPGSTKEEFRASQNAIIKGRRATSFAVSINLSYPREIHSVRRAPVNGQHFFENGLPEVTTDIAVTQVLVYDVKELSDVVLEPTDRRREGLNARELEMPYGNNDVVNLHVFASPREEKGLSKTHFIEVFQALAGAYGFVISPLEKDRPDAEKGEPLKRDMTPRQILDVPPSLNEEKIAGLNWRDTVSLHELRPRPAVSPANCNMLVCKNRAPTNAVKRST